jgi:hypothetical protein
MSGEGQVSRLEALKRAAREYLDLRLRFYKRSEEVAVEEYKAFIELLDRHPILQELYPGLRQKLESWMKWCEDTASYEDFIALSRKRIEEARTVEEVLEVLENVNRECFERELSGPRAEG